MAYTAWHDYFSDDSAQEALEAVKAIPLYQGNPVVFLDIAVDGEVVGRLTFQLRHDVAPMTAESFRQLCTGEPGWGYAGTRVHALVRGSYLQGGDITHGTGLGGRSAFDRPIPTESMALKHIGPGTLSMHSPGAPNNATSQFVVALSKQPMLDARNVVFGNLVDGFDVLRSIEARCAEGAHEVTVASSGELRVPEDAKVAMLREPGGVSASGKFKALHAQRKREAEEAAKAAQ